MFGSGNGSKKIPSLYRDDAIHHSNGSCQPQMADDTKDLSGRLARWSLQLQPFDFEIIHRKGSENIVADMLSRLSTETVEELNN